MKAAKQHVNKGLNRKVLVLAAHAFCLATQGADVSKMRHSMVAGNTGKFCGWPANNGVWTWDGGREILVGFSCGDFVEQQGSNVKGQSDTTSGLLNLLTRSQDGGRTWKAEKPQNFVGDGVVATASPGGLDFSAPGFAMRVVGTGYHGSRDPLGSFFVSMDRGLTWRGPYRFGALMNEANLQDMELTARTSYLRTGPRSCLLFMSARPRASKPGAIPFDKSFVAETTDGGKSFRFVSWIVPLKDPYGAVMPAVGRLADGTIIAALRRCEVTNVEKKQTPCWVDCYASTDNGRSWNFLSRLGETGLGNGSPPGLTVLRDGRTVCAYGDSSRGKLFARISVDGGKEWESEVVLRDDFQPDRFNDRELGYPQLTTNDRGDVVALYHWAALFLPEDYIAMTLWSVLKQVAASPRSIPLFTETFDTASSAAAHGWMSSGHAQGKSTFSWNRASILPDKAKGGSAGGTFSRTKRLISFADSKIGRFKRNGTLRLAGCFKLANVNFDGHIYLGYFTPGEGDSPFVGMTFLEPSGDKTHPFRGMVEIRGPGAACSDVISVPQNTAISFDLTWIGKMDGSGTLSGTLAGQNVSVTAGTGTGTFTAFGLLCGGSGSDTDEKTALCTFDNLLYNKDDASNTNP